VTKRKVLVILLKKEANPAINPLYKILKPFVIYCNISSLIHIQKTEDVPGVTFPYSIVIGKENHLFVLTAVEKKVHFAFNVLLEKTR